jgi:hypothetical protein
LIFLIFLLNTKTTIKEANVAIKNKPLAPETTYLSQSNGRAKEGPEAIPVKTNKIKDIRSTAVHILKDVNKLFENWKTLSLIK